MCLIKKRGENCLVMENNERILNLLGLAMRAGKLVTGEEMTLQRVRSGQVKLVVLANDVSENTLKKMTNKCQSYHTPLISPFNSGEISHAIGKSRRIIGVCDSGFAKKMSDLMKE